MKSLTHFEASLVSGGDITLTLSKGTMLVNLSERSDSFTLVASHPIGEIPLTFTRNDDGMVQAHFTLASGAILLVPPEFNLSKGVVGLYAI